MKRYVLKCVIFLGVALSMTGCATSQGFNRQVLSTQIQEQELDEVLALKPQLSFPFKLAVYFNHPPEGSWSQQWQWRVQDKEILLAMEEELQARRIISEMVVITGPEMTGTNLGAIRVAAARHSADAVLVITGIADIDDYNNLLAMTYVGLVTALFVPGSEIDALFMVNAILWDVNNQFLYFAAEAEGTSHQMRPPILIRESLAIENAKRRAVPLLYDELIKKMETLAEKYASPSES